MDAFISFLLQHTSQLLSLGQGIYNLMGHPNTVSTNPAVVAAHNDRIDSLIGIAKTVSEVVAQVAPLCGSAAPSVATAAAVVEDVAQEAQSVYTPPQAAGVPVLGVVIPAGQEADPAPTS